MAKKLIFLLLFLSFGIRAQDYPAKNVTLIVPYPAGGPTDQLARVLAQKFQERLGQPFIVENVTGGGTTIATGRAARAAPDGYTLLLHNLQIAVNPTLYGKLPYDTEKDLAAIAFVNRNPMVLVGRKDLPPNGLAELLAYMKTKQVTVANAGSGSTAHLLTALMGREAGAKVLAVPYRGGAPMVQDLLGGVVDLTFGTPQQLAPLVAAGRLKTYGVTQKETLAQFPGGESLVSVVGPKLEVYYWSALFAPAATPKPVIDKLNAVVQAVVEDPTIAKGWADIGVTPYPKEERSPQAAQALLHSELERWGAVVRENGIQAAQ